VRSSRCGKRRCLPRAAASSCRGSPEGEYQVFAWVDVQTGTNTLEPGDYFNSPCQCILRMAPAMRSWAPFSNWMRTSNPPAQPSCRSAHQLDIPQGRGARFGPNSLQHEMAAPASSFTPAQRLLLVGSPPGIHDQRHRDGERQSLADVLIYATGQVEKSTRTDEQGRYILPGLKGTTVIRPELPGWVFLPPYKQVHRTSTVDFTAVVGAVLSGTIAVEHSFPAPLWTHSR